MSARKKGSPRFLCTAAMSMGPRALTAALPETLTALGMGIPAPGSTQQGKGESTSGSCERRGADVQKER